MKLQTPNSKNQRGFRTPETVTQQFLIVAERVKRFCHFFLPLYSPTSACQNLSAPCMRVLHPPAQVNRTKATG